MPEIHLAPRHVVSTYGHGIGQIEGTCTCGVHFGYRSREADLLVDIEAHRAEVLPYEEAEAELLAEAEAAAERLSHGIFSARAISVRLRSAMANYRKVRR